MSEVLDESALLESLGGDRELLREVVGLFVADTPGMLAQIRKAIADRDSRALHAVAHKLKGSISVFSAPAALEAARELEAMGRAEDLERASQASSVLEAEVARVQQALSDLVAREGA